MRLAQRRASWIHSANLLEGSIRQLRVGGEWVDVASFGEGDPIVLVPGLAGGWRLVAPLAERLARRNRVILYGLRGDRFPASGRFASDAADYALDLSEVIGQLGLERPTVMGVSFGAAVALELAIERPALLGGLVLVGGDSSFPSTIGSTIARRVLERFPLPRDSRFINQFFNLLHGSRPEPGPLTEFVTERIWETDQCVIARRLAALESYDVTDRLWRIEAPTLVIAGSRDAIVPAVRQKALAESIPGATFEALVGAGHIGFLTHRGEIAGHVARMVRRVNAHVA